jgi:uncharacterized protein (DUF2141 family)
MIFGCGQETSTKQLIPSQEIDRNAIELAQPQSSGEEFVAPTESIRKIRLVISVTGFQTNEGNCRIAIYLNQSHFNDPEYAIAKESIGIVDLKADWQMDLEIPERSATEAKAPNRLAVSAYHDANTNTRLDKNSFGMPTERYGFSKNPKRGFGPPKFIETALELDLSDSLTDSPVVVEVPIQIK